MASVRRVLPFWSSVFPGTDLVSFLDLADEVIAGRQGARDFSRRIDALQDLHQAELDRTTDVGVMDGPLMVLWAATRAGAAALGEDRDADDLAFDRIDPWAWSASLAASISAAGGATWDRRGDPDARRAFWTWWLKSGASTALEGR